MLMFLPYGVVLSDDQPYHLESVHRRLRVATSCLKAVVQLGEDVPGQLHVPCVVDELVLVELILRVVANLVDQLCQPVPLKGFLSCLHGLKEFCGVRPPRRALQVLCKVFHPADHISLRRNLR